MAAWLTSSSATSDWSSPQWLVDQLAAEFAPNGWDLDPAAGHDNHKAPRYITKDDNPDGLSQPWCASRVYLNPPYGRGISQWIDKAIEETANGNAALIVALLPVRADVHWWGQATGAASLVRVLPGRLRFNDSDSAPFASVVMTFGRLTGRHGTQPARCAVCHRWYWPAYACRTTCSERCRKAAYRAGLSQI